MSQPTLPDRKYFKIGDAAVLLGVKPHVLRYWETEFPQIKPVKSKTGQRLYRRRDMEYLIEVQRLLYEKKFTIAGARQVLRQSNYFDAQDLEEAPLPPDVALQPATVEQIAEELRVVDAIIDIEVPQQDECMLSEVKEALVQPIVSQVEAAAPIEAEVEPQVVPELNLEPMNTQASALPVEPEKHAIDPMVLDAVLSKLTQAKTDLHAVLATLHQEFSLELKDNTKG